MNTSPKEALIESISRISGPVFALPALQILPLAVLVTAIPALSGQILDTNLRDSIQAEIP